LENFSEGKKIFNFVDLFKKSQNFKQFEKEYDSFKNIFNVTESNDVLLFKNKNNKKNMVFANIIQIPPIFILENIKKNINDNEILAIIDESILFLKERERKIENINQLNIKKLI
jgi:hypothetical protein